MDWYIINKEYVNFLHNIDSKVGLVEYGDKIKLHIGVLFAINSIQYYVPVSSPKPKHYHMKNTRDFHKLIDDNGKLYAVININNMIPVLDQYATLLSYKDLIKYRKFDNDQELSDYVLLLQIEKTIIDRDSKAIQEKALKLYENVKQYPKSSIAQRCCNFSLLEKEMHSYSSII